ncbi:MAG: HAD family hydrolase [Bdellovibrionales bacterium]|nr:HAD family hydrolase [Bdellovibrionales bacterium]
MNFSLSADIRCVVWDWNGTIYDDARICQDITNEQLQVLGLEPLQYETQEILFKHPVEQYYRDMGARLSRAEFERLSVDFHDEYGRQRKRGIVRPEAIELLRRIQQTGRQQVVLSAYRENDLQSLVQEVDLDQYFTAILGLADCHAEGKVSRGVFWLREHGLSPREVLVIGDTNHDFEVAQAMGCQVVLTPSGYQHKNLLLQTGAPVIDSLALVRVDGARQCDHGQA